MSERKKCLKCQKDKILKNEFFVSYSDWHGDGRLPYCKDCLKDGVELNNEDSFRSIMRRIDRPFKYHTWKKARESRNDTFGTYMKDLALNYKYDTYEDSDPRSNTAEEVNDDRLFVEEDKVYSKKWLGYFTPTDIDYLEEYYSGLDRDFRIVTTNHKDYAKKIAKASLHMDKCFQEMQNGVTGSDKRYREAKDIFDTLSKSAKFSESQRGITDVGMGSISQIVEMVESETYVYEHKNDLDKDMYDKLLEDFRHINKSL